MAELEVAVAMPAQRVALENLLQLYIRFADCPLDAFWRERDHVNSPAWNGPVLRFRASRS